MHVKITLSSLHVNIRQNEFYDLSNSYNSPLQALGDTTPTSFGMDSWTHNDLGGTLEVDRVVVKSW